MEKSCTSLADDKITREKKDFEVEMKIRCVQAIRRTQRYLWSSTSKVKIMTVEPYPESRKIIRH